ncbi:hypothetical protein FKW77_007147 [Venturia effusa]|uniref:Hydrophobin n=1 Tax=Venturia effusa TaxID=50376 RepID=A0A517LPA5_9PEZI|nr:hypothetical protein FKW77_007147 [Venturia effusa]
MHGLLTLSLLALGASAAFVCKDKKHRMHVCCAALAQGKEHKGVAPMEGQKCLAAIMKRDPKTKQKSYSCPLHMTGLAGLLPGIALPTQQPLIAACCHTNIPGLTTNYGHDCIKVEGADTGEIEGTEPDNVNVKRSDHDDEQQGESVQRKRDTKTGHLFSDWDLWDNFLEKIGCHEN